MEELQQQLERQLVLRLLHLALQPSLAKGSWLLQHVKEHLGLQTEQERSLGWLEGGGEGVHGRLSKLSGWNLCRRLL